MPRRKEPKIPDALLDQLLAGADPKTAFDPNGLLDGLKGFPEAITAVFPEATIQAFSSSVQRRRRPTPVITSSRRKPSAFILIVAL
jgi:hypothetical protein